MLLSTTSRRGELSTVNCPGCMETRRRFPRIKLPNSSNCGLNSRRHGTLLTLWEPNGITSEAIRNSSMPRAAFHSRTDCSAARLAEANSRIFSDVTFFNRHLRLDEGNFVLMQA
jgi:hypothetical protein